MNHFICYYCGKELITDLDTYEVGWGYVKGHEGRDVCPECLAFEEEDDEDE
jgi:hypothetical protein